MPRWEPPTEQIIQPPKPKRWPFVVLMLAVLGVAIGGAWMIWRRRHAALRGDALPTATDVRSELTSTGDSLQVIVSWQLDATSASGRVDSVRVEVGLGQGRESQTRVRSSDQHADTLRLSSPAPGQTASGYSCVATVRGARLSRETCTPWQFVRPTAEVPAPPGAPRTPPTDSANPSKRQAATAEATVARIVLQPEAQQVDPDVGGKCSAWQRTHPGLNVWVDVNREAVPDCTGPNGKPTVAKFCAFAILSDGSRVKTATSANDPYCERLFQAWLRQRVV
jgi:hypothetical protein